MNQKEIQVLLRKADELRALFVLGQRVIPFLEEIFLFVSDIDPILHEINTSIKDNLKKMPKASKQLSKVTEATELATTEILDILDGLSYKNELINSNLKKINDLVLVKDNKPLDLLKLLLNGAKKGSDLNGFVNQISEFVSVYENNLDKKIDEVIKNTKDINNSIVNDSSAIAMSLQVQDITSQQIAAVNNLLETVQGRLTVIMEKFKASDLESIINEEIEEHHDKKAKVNVLHRTIAYDPDAVDAFDTTKNRQSDVDEMFNKAKDNPIEEVENDTIAGQNDIDNLINSFATESTEIASKTNSFESNVVANNESFSIPEKIEEVEEVEDSDSEDILDVNLDALGDLDDEVSQDDIDALFGKL